MRYRLFLVLIASFLMLSWNNQVTNSKTQDDLYWQQHVDYTMEIDMDVENYRYHGEQTLVYTNNSPDTLNRVFYHLYFNAFQPGSEMDVRSRTILDPSSKIGDRIEGLAPDEIGMIVVNSLDQNGEKVKHKTEGTILEVTLNEPILPGSSTTFTMDFDGQVPVQIRRSGRNNKEGVVLSMAQWYPKLAEYDDEGWHANAYIAREFHGVWGDFDVKISIDKSYVIGGTGYLQNSEEIGHGYTNKNVKIGKNVNKLTWHFNAPMVHDFTWAADPDYIHDTAQVPNGPLLHFFYQDDENIIENWKALQPKTVDLMQYFSREIGEYPFEQYSVIQAGDGGMEYGMCTFITGDRSFESLLGVTAHEMAHTWFQFLLATNESKHEWMDEGFTNYIEEMALNEIQEKNLPHPTEKAYKDYIAMALSGKEQPLSTHADRYDLNTLYGTSAYDKGSVFLAQLGYVIGEDNLKKTIKRYFKEWSFKHPKPTAIIRSAEKVSGIELDWYLMDFAQTINRIDYGVSGLSENDGKASISLKRIGLMPMPIDLRITFMDGTSTNYYIPLRMMRGEKPVDPDTIILEDWAWVNPNYKISLDRPESEIKSVTIDPENKMADINKYNNTL